MAAAEKLRKGFTRLPSGSLRVRVRLAGIPAATRTFPIFSDALDERKRQLAEAKAWAETMRRDLQAGAQIAPPAPNLSLGDALRRYQVEGLKSADDNRAPELYRIGVILRDPIAKMPLARLRKIDVARFRDRLIGTHRIKKLKAKMVAAATPDERLRLGKIITDLERLQAATFDTDTDAFEAAAARIAAIDREEAIGKPAKTTIGNTVQLIGRALKRLAETTDGVPDVSGVSMPSATAGRERRLREGEEELLVEVGRKIDPRLPLMIQFAIETTLRRGRVLTFMRADIRDVGRGRRSIVFAKATEGRRKRTGVPPVTREVQRIIEAAVGLGDDKGGKAPLFGMSKDEFTGLWNRLLREVGIDDLHFHDLRHEGTSRLFERGLSMAEVQSITGHSTTEMVDRYSHYGAALVGEKLDRGVDAESVLDEMRVPAARYLALGGQREALINNLIS